MNERLRRTPALAWCIGLGALGTSLGLAADPPPILIELHRTVMFGDARGLASADFNGDGRKDLAIVVSGEFGVRILLGLGDGTFSPGPTALGSMAASSLAVADFNRDGRQDLAVSDEFVREVRVGFGNADGTFTTGPASATGLIPFSLASANFNGDIWPDLLVGGPDHGIAVFFNLHDGVLGPRIDVAPDGGAPLTIGRVSYRATDLDGDDRDDIIVAGWEVVLSGCLGDGFVRYRNLGAGAFLPTSYPGALCPFSLKAADWNRDGRRDVLVRSSNGLRLYANLGGGSFALPSSLSTLANGSHFVVSDLNLDGFLDVAINQSFDLYLHPGRDDGMLASVEEGIFVHGSLVDGLADDFNGDGLPDLVLTLNDTESTLTQIFLNRSVPSPSPVGEASLQVTGYDPASGDVAFDYGPTCGATSHSLVYGSLDPPDRGTYAGRLCGLGTSGAGTFHPGPGSVFFLLVGETPAIEGSYGRTSFGAERPESSGLGACDRPQVLTAHCP